MGALARRCFACGEPNAWSEVVCKGCGMPLPPRGPSPEEVARQWGAQAYGRVPLPPAGPDFEVLPPPGFGVATLAAGSHLVRYDHLIPMEAIFLWCLWTAGAVYFTTRVVVDRLGAMLAGIWWWLVDAVLPAMTAQDSLSPTTVLVAAERITDTRQHLWTTHVVDGPLGAVLVATGWWLTVVWLAVEVIHAAVTTTTLHLTADQATWHKRALRRRATKVIARADVQGVVQRGKDDPEGLSSWSLELQTAQGAVTILDSEDSAEGSDWLGRRLARWAGVPFVPAAEQR